MRLSVAASHEPDLDAGNRCLNRYQSGDMPRYPKAVSFIYERLNTILHCPAVIEDAEGIFDALSAVAQAGPSILPNGTAHEAMNDSGGLCSPSPEQNLGDGRPTKQKRKSCDAEDHMTAASGRRKITNIYTNPHHSRHRTFFLMSNGHENGFHYMYVETYPVLSASNNILKQHVSLCAAGREMPAERKRAVV